MVGEKSFLAFIQFFLLDASMPLPLGFSKVLQYPKDPLRKEQISGKVKISYMPLYTPKIKWIQTIKWKAVRAAWIFFSPTWFLGQTKNFTQSGILEPTKRYVPGRQEPKFALSAQSNGMCRNI